MGVRVTELQCKEVVCISDGSRLGFVSDVEVQVPEGCVLAIIVPCKCRHFGLLGGKDDFVIPWKCIKRVGDDIILVDIRPSECRIPRKKPQWFA